LLFLGRCEEGAALWNEDLHFSVLKVNMEETSSDYHAVSCVEDVADSGSFSEARVGDISVGLSIDVVGKGNEEISS
jgi:hypothetical protein